MTSTPQSQDNSKNTQTAKPVVMDHKSGGAAKPAATPAARPADASKKA
jgi:hypothetical protein